MAVDATGTPTSLGIPKFNTAVDPPSGKGFNAAMDAIDALILARAPKPVGATPVGQYLRWDGTAFTSEAPAGFATIGLVVALGG